MSNIINDLINKALSVIPLMVDPTVETVALNQDNPVSVNPTVAGTERNNNYPIIVIPGVMGSRLWMKGDGKC